MVGLALAFLASSLSAFFTPNEFHDIITQSLVFNKTLDVVPFFITLIGVSDLIVCLLLFSRLFSKVAALWATLWLSCVIVVFLSQQSLGGFLAAIDHGAPLGIALYLLLRKSPPVSATPQPPMNNP